MKLDLEFLPMVGTAAGILVGLQLKHRCIAVDHLTIKNVDPSQWDQVFLLAAETTFKIRHHMERIGDKLVVICTSDEPGLERWSHMFFPHWLMAVHDSNPDYRCSGHFRLYMYDALLGRAKDARTKLLLSLERTALLEHGLISYNPGGHYSANQELDGTRFYNQIWQDEDPNIVDIYGNEINYRVSFDSTTRLPSGHFSSCKIPAKVYESTAVSVVAETDSIGDHVFVTEKTWKPIVSGKSFLLYATPRHEKFLEDLGFKIPHKTNGDPEELVQHLIDGRWYFDHDALEHNRQLADKDRWIKRLYDWLDQFRT